VKILIWVTVIIDTLSIFVFITDVVLYWVITGDVRSDTGSIAVMELINATAAYILYSMYLARRG
jgi:hypothetical protein